MYEGGVKNSFKKSLKTAIVTFHSGFIGYALFSSLEGSKALHEFTLSYNAFFMENLNYLNLGFALSLSGIVITYFLLAFGLYALFDSTYNNTKHHGIRNGIESIFNIIIGVGFAGFGLAIFSPYLEYTRDLYNNYHLMLGMEIMLITLIMLVGVLIIQYSFNTYRKPIGLFNFLKKKNNHAAEAPINYSEEFDDEGYKESVASDDFVPNYHKEAY